MCDRYAYLFTEVRINHRRNVEKDEAELNNVDFDVDEEALEAIRETTYENYGITVEEFDKLYETESGQAKLAYLAEQIKLKKSM